MKILRLLRSNIINRYEAHRKNHRWVFMKEVSKYLFLFGTCVFFFVILNKKLSRSPEYSPATYFSDGSLSYIKLSRDEHWRRPIDLNNLPSHVTQGLFCLEDKNFYRHSGIDLVAIARAVSQNISAKRIVSGGSTLSMQVARMQFRLPRTFVSKIYESMYALYLEVFLSKKQILQLYLDSAPFGGNVEGLETASQLYFQKSAQFLNPAETAFLYLLPQSPKRIRQLDKNVVMEARNRNLARWKACRVLSELDYAKAIQTAIPQVKYPMPHWSPHLNEWILSQPLTVVNATSLDSGIQKQLERLVQDRRMELNEQGVYNIAALVVENKSQKILGAIGNFSNKEFVHGQQISSFFVNRSTGSLLKPFIFSLLLQNGEIFPETLLEDIPTKINDYEPENYDNTYSGLVAADSALAHSLNVPWIRELKKIGYESLLRLLSYGGINPNRPIGEYGLSIAIGSYEANLWNMVRAYSALANGGKISDLQWLNETHSKSEIGTKQKAKLNTKQWLDEGASYLTGKALTIRGRPDYIIDPTFLRDKTLRWKTGTSQGRKDAWMIGFTGAVTIGVWLGNLDNTPSPALTGAELAAPLVFDIYKSIQQNQSDMSHEIALPTKQLSSYEVCEFSGLPASPACTHKKSVIGIKNAPLKRTCPYHQHVLVDIRTEKRVDQNCAPDTKWTAVKTYLSLPPDLSFWSHIQLRELKTTPDYDSRCESLAVEKGQLKILSPENKNYLMHSGFLNNLMELPLEVTASNLGDWRCYINGKILDSDFINQRVLQLPTGDYNLFCSDSLGRSDKTNFTIQ
jgi:penicillin-binding protein 1C